jgi:hypothetical protein
MIEDVFDDGFDPGVDGDLEIHGSTLPVEGPKQDRA